MTMTMKTKEEKARAGSLVGNEGMICPRPVGQHIEIGRSGISVQNPGNRPPGPRIVQDILRRAAE